MKLWNKWTDGVFYLCLLVVAIVLFYGSQCIRKQDKEIAVLKDKVKVLETVINYEIRARQNEISKE